MPTGLFLTRRQGRISKVIDLDGLAESHSDLAVVKVYDEFFEKNKLRDMLYRVRENKLDAVVLAGHSAYEIETRLVGRTLINALTSLGVNHNRIVFVNIYEHVSQIHSDQPVKATLKAHLLIDAALAKVAHSRKVKTVPVNPIRSVLVMGATLTGMIAASHLLSNKIEVVVVEKSNVQGITWSKEDVYAFLLHQVNTNPKSAIFFESDLMDISGWTGDYQVLVKTPEGIRELNVGSILLCMGNNRRWIDQLQNKMRLDVDVDGFLVDVSGNRASGETKDAGIWFATSMDVLKAVSTISALLDKPRFEYPLLVTEVNEAVCSGCGTCVKTCAYAASRIDIIKKISIINTKRCKGCGNCVTACPTSARELVTFPKQYVNSAIEILSQGVSDNDEPKILAFLCKNSGYVAADDLGKQSIQNSGAVRYSPSVLPLPVECGGNIDTAYILKAFQEGFDGVALVICKDHHCHNLIGNTDMERRVGLLRAILRSRRIDDNRIRIIHVNGREGHRLNEELKAFSAELRN